ncbi:MAG: tRNA 4-thiouridine(8) synthase ThiI [Defluviitaleaceae bacterium]|nr:tRNA 4-thiouridine(8) synthase ThiI [Defluviitaleaceae bacterium]
MKKGLLVKYGELAIRGKNRHLFEAQLIKAIRKNIDTIGSDFFINKEQGRFFVFDKKNDFPDTDLLIEKTKDILGIVGLSPCIVTDNSDFENIKALALNFFNENHADRNIGASFRVVTKRADKKYPMNSNEISAEVAGHILDNHPDLKVNLKNPDISLHVEIRNENYIYSKTVKGLGGLPAGSSGKGVLLLSGGIDSPVAGFMMQKRGISLEAVYFDSPPYTSIRAKEKVIDLARELMKFTGELRLHVIPFTKTQLYIYENVPAEKMTIFLKRAMLKTADKIAHKIGAYALVTGDSVGQVASQTLRSINAVESAATMPILRPLAGLDKIEIIEIAKKINTYDISIRPFEDCCTIFVAKHPETKPKTSVIENMEERRLKELDNLIDEAIEQAEIIDI